MMMLGKMSETDSEAGLEKDDDDDDDDERTADGELL